MDTYGLKRKLGEKLEKKRKVSESLNKIRQGLYRVSGGNVIRNRNYYSSIIV